MRAFEVYLNDKKLCLAGIRDAGVLTTIVNWVAGKQGTDMFLQIGGLDSAAAEHVSWVNQQALRIGDEIKVKIVDVVSVDKPELRYSTDSADHLRQRKDYIRKAAEEFGWKIEADKATG